MSYWDTSALLKLYVSELDSGQFVRLAAKARHLVTCFIGKHEIRAALKRRESDGELPSNGAFVCYQAFLRDIELGRIRVIPESATLEHEFGKILDVCLSASPRLLIRTNDALHLAAAKLSMETEFVTADARQRAAAAHLGFTLLS